MKIVTKVRKETSTDGTHRHLEGVCTIDETHYSRGQVVASINAGEDWYTSAGGHQARIKPMTYCPAPACRAQPYITTAPDHTTVNNLENLPPC